MGFWAHSLSASIMSEICHCSHLGHLISGVGLIRLLLFDLKVHFSAQPKMAWQLRFVRRQLLELPIRLRQIVLQPVQKEVKMANNVHTGHVGQFCDGVLVVYGALFWVQFFKKLSPIQINPKASSMDSFWRWIRFWLQFCVYRVIWCPFDIKNGIFGNNFSLRRQKWNSDVEI